MAFDGRQAQAQHLPGEGFTGQLGFDLAQPAALAQHQLTHAPLLALREAGRIDMGQQVGAVPVVIVVRNHEPDLVQGAAPGQFAPGVDVGVGQRAVEESQCHFGNALRLRRVDAEALLQFGHRGVAHVARALEQVHLKALVQVDDHALPQRALGRPEGADAEVRGQCVQDGQAAGQHGTPLGLEPGQVEAVDLAGLQAARHAPAQALRRDAAIAHARGQQDLRDPAGGTG